MGVRGECIGWVYEGSVGWVYEGSVGKVYVLALYFGYEHWCSRFTLFCVFSSRIVGER